MQLLPDVECHKDPPLFVWRPRGVLNEEKVNEIVGFVTDHEKKYEEVFDRFTDLALLDAIDLTFKFVFQVSLYRRLARVGQEPIKSAFLVSNPSVARYVKLHALVTDHSPLMVEMFEDRDAAAEWLAVSPALLAPK